jgi:hypothetical protein
MSLSERRKAPKLGPSHEKKRSAMLTCTRVVVSMKKIGADRQPCCQSGQSGIKSGGSQKRNQKQNRGSKQEREHGCCGRLFKTRDTWPERDSHRSSKKHTGSPCGH